MEGGGGHSEGFRSRGQVLSVSVRQQGPDVPREAASACGYYNPAPPIGVSLLCCSRGGHTHFSSLVGLAGDLSAELRHPQFLTTKIKLDAMTPHLKIAGVQRWRRRE